MTTTDPCEANILCHITGLKTDVARIAAQQSEVNNIVEQFGNDLDAAEAEIDALEIALAECCEDEEPVTICGWTIVTNDAELREAAAVGGMILVVGEIILESTIDFTVPGTHVYGKPDSEGNPAKIVLPYNAEITQDVIRISASRIGIHYIEVTTNNPLPNLPVDESGLIIGGTPLDWGIRLNVSSSNDVSDAVIEHCYIHHVCGALVMQGNSSTIWANRVRILNNRVESFNYIGIFFDWYMQGLVVENNRVWGRRKSGQTPHQSYPLPADESHTVIHNCMLIATYIDRAVIKNNDVAWSDRHAIEIINNQYNTLTPSSLPTANEGLIVDGNNIHDVRGFGISANGGIAGFVVSCNILRNVEGYGIELSNLSTTGNMEGHYVVTGNRIVNQINNFPSQIPMGIAINASTGGIITGNYFENIRSSTVGQHAYGIAIQCGPLIVHPEVPRANNITISENHFVDGGNVNIIIRGTGPSDTFTNITIQGNVSIFTTNRAHVVDAEAAVALLYCDNPIVCRNNVMYHPASDLISSLSLTGFNLVHDGTVYVGNSSDPPVVNSTPGSTVPLNGSNLSITY